MCFLESSRCECFVLLCSCAVDKPDENIDHTVTTRFSKILNLASFLTVLITNYALNEQCCTFFSDIATVHMILLYVTQVGWSLCHAVSLLQPGDTHMIVYIFLQFS